ncbi:hypothetical protein MTO96_001993 [Rhipicephalus appendiculatus]
MHIVLIADAKQARCLICAVQPIFLRAPQTGLGARNPQIQCCPLRVVDDCISVGRAVPLRGRLPRRRSLNFLRRLSAPSAFAVAPGRAAMVSAVAARRPLGADLPSPDTSEGSADVPQ